MTFLLPVDNFKTELDKLLTTCYIAFAETLLLQREKNMDGDEFKFQPLEDMRATLTGEIFARERRPAPHTSPLADIAWEKTKLSLSFQDDDHESLLQKKPTLFP